MPRSLQEIIAHADQLAKKFEDYEPKSEDERPIMPLYMLRAAAKARADAERQILEAVHAARAAKYSWASIGTELGTSGQAAQQKYGPASVN
ncbi:MAG: hypothetical protein ACRDPW_01205 [Mycobacteriales bacterium]